MLSFQFCWYNIYIVQTWLLVLTPPGGTIEEIPVGISEKFQLSWRRDQSQDLLHTGTSVSNFKPQAQASKFQKCAPCYLYAHGMEI